MPKATKTLKGNDLYNLADKMNSYARDLSGRVRVEFIAGDIVFFNAATDEIVDYYLQADGQSAAKFAAGAFDAVDSVSKKIAANAAAEMEKVIERDGSAALETPTNNAAADVAAEPAGASLEHGRKPSINDIVAWYSPADLLALVADRFVAIHSKDGVKAFDAANEAYGDITDRIGELRKRDRYEGRVLDLAAAVELLKESTDVLIEAGPESRIYPAVLRTWRNRLENLFNLPGYIRDEATNRMSIDAFIYFEFPAAVRAFGALESNDAIVDVIAVFKEFAAARPFDRKGDDADTAEAFADRAGRCKYCPNILAGGEIETGVCDVCRNSPTIGGLNYEV